MLSYVASDLATLEEDSRLPFSLGTIEQRTRAVIARPVSAEVGVMTV